MGSIYLTCLLFILVVLGAMPSAVGFKLFRSSHISAMNLTVLYPNLRDTRRERISAGPA